MTRIFLNGEITFLLLQREFNLINLIPLSTIRDNLLKTRQSQRIRRLNILESVQLHLTEIRRNDRRRLSVRLSGPFVPKLLISMQPHH